MGDLIFRSTFMPRMLGVFIAFDGVAWMAYPVPRFAVSVFQSSLSCSVALKLACNCGCSCSA